MYLLIFRITTAVRLSRFENRPFKCLWIPRGVGRARGVRLARTAGLNIRLARSVFAPREVVQTEWEFLCSKPSVQAICPGDSGGPLMCNGFQYGVASHAYSMSRQTTVQCGNADVQTRHLFVYEYMDWILSVRNAGKPALVFRHRKAAVAVVTCGALYSAAVTR